MLQLFVDARARFSDDDSGATAIEYSLIVALIAVAIIGVLTSLGGTNGGSWDSTAGKAGAALGG